MSAREKEGPVVSDGRERGGCARLANWAEAMGEIREGTPLGQNRERGKLFSFFFCLFFYFQTFFKSILKSV